MDLYSYPIKFITAIQLDDGTIVQLRPIHPLDRMQVMQFKNSLSATSMYARFLNAPPRISENLIKRLIDIDYSKEMAIVAEVDREAKKEIIAVSRIVGDGKHSVEFAIIISDKWQGKKLGHILTGYMIKIAKDMGFNSISALVFSNNTRMLKILRHKGFEFTREDNITIQANLNLLSCDIFHESQKDCICV